MKLRIKDNSIRLRLSQSEVATLKKKARVRGETRFPGSLLLSYGLEQTEDSHIAVRFAGNNLTILVPSDVMKSWVETDQVGFQAEIPVGDDESLDILVEKDFQCLTARPGEDESDLYPNPLESHT